MTMKMWMQFNVMPRTKIKKFRWGRQKCFVSVSFQQPAHVKQNAETNSKVGAACQAGLVVDLIAGLAATRLPARDGSQKPASL